MKTRRLCLLVLFLFGFNSTQAADISSYLGRQLDLIFEDPAFHRAFWGVKVVSIDTGETLYQKNPYKYFMPASNMKLVTALAAVENLGLTHQFETVVSTDGKISRGTLKGNLFIKGTGDPTIGARSNSTDFEDPSLGDPLATFKKWAADLKALGINRIEGDLVGDDLLFNSSSLGEGWAWDDLPYAYSAGIGALQFNENAVLLRISPSKEKGQAPSAQLFPRTSFVTIQNELQAGDVGDELELQVERLPGNRFVLRGVLPEGSGPIERSLAVSDSTGFFLHELLEGLEEEGVRVEGKTRSLRDWAGDSEKTRTVLFTHRSQDLSYVLKVLLKVSQNLYAETLVKAMDPRPMEKSFDGGREVVESFLTKVGIPEDSYELVDASGLSRYNLLTPETLIRLLVFAQRQPYRDKFMELLPVGGIDGTIRGRMKGTAAEGNVRAKTGTISYVRALSGYVKTRDGETLAFSMLVNHYTQSRRAAEYLQDAALQVLANVSRDKCN